jgi:citrate synthase
VYVDHVGAAVVAVEGCAEGGAPEEVAEVLMEMRDEETIEKVNDRERLTMKMPQGWQGYTYN